MHIAITKPLFAWDCLQDSPSLATVKEFLASLPDARLLEMLHLYRGHGRDDYPVHVLWAVLILRIALRHVSFEATLGELNRNEALRRLIGIEEERHVPKSWNVSRFLDVLGQEPHLGELRRIFDTMIQRLGLEHALLCQPASRRPLTFHNANGSPSLIPAGPNWSRVGMQIAYHPREKGPRMNEFRDAANCQKRNRSCSNWPATVASN